MTSEPTLRTLDNARVKTNGFFSTHFWSLKGVWFCSFYIYINFHIQIYLKPRTNEENNNQLWTFLRETSLIWLLRLPLDHFTGQFITVLCVWCRAADTLLSVFVIELLFMWNSPSVAALSDRCGTKCCTPPPEPRWRRSSASDTLKMRCSAPWRFVFFNADVNWRLP